MKLSCNCVCYKWNCHHWSRWWPVAWSAPSHHINQCCLVVDWPIFQQVISRKLPQKIVIQNRLLFCLIGSVNDLDAIACPSVSLLEAIAMEFGIDIIATYGTFSIIFILVTTDVMGDNWCGRFGLWPFRSVAVSVCGRSGLWPFRFVAVSVCGHFGLWPFRFVAV